MSAKRKAYGLVAATATMLSCIAIFVPQSTSAAVWLTTTDPDFYQGDLFQGTDFETEVHGTAIDAYVQNKMDMVSWFESPPQTNLGPRRSFGFTNDSDSGRLVLFGGLNGSDARNDTWAFDFGTRDWMRICADDTPECAPPKRAFASMAYDNNSKVAVLYGGIAADLMTTLTDTWELHVNNGTWVNRTSGIAPQGITSHSMVYDTMNKRIILIGRGASSMEVWAYDADSHSWTEMEPSGGPSMRSGFALGYNYQASHRQVVLFGGSELLDIYADTWEYDLATNSWSEVFPTNSPGPKTGAAMTHASMRSIQGLVIWGGVPFSNDTWRYSWDGSIPRWIRLFSDTSPSPLRKDHGMAYDPLNDELMVFGGVDQMGGTLDDVWLVRTGYRHGGKYASAFFDSFHTDTEWNVIFWNDTPAEIPSGTLMRFQLNWSNSCDNTEAPMWQGPDGTADTYYEVPGSPIWKVTARCLRFMADLITTDISVAPRLEDVAITFGWASPPLPKVTDYAPILYTYPVDSPIYINFSVPMNINNVWLSINPNVTLDTPWTWYKANMGLKITHSSDPFHEGLRYDVCVWGTSEWGSPLEYPDNRFCWPFTTPATPPNILFTSPPHNSMGVGLTDDIIVNFSEPMDPTTFVFSLVPSVGTLTYRWINDNRTVIISHATPFNECTFYVATVLSVRSEEGESIVSGPLPNPWTFSTFCCGLWLTKTTPANGALGVDPLDPVIVRFSCAIDKPTFNYSIIPSIVFDQVSWIDDVTVKLDHSQGFVPATTYQMRVGAIDVYGEELIPGPIPNPWNFTTQCRCIVRGLEVDRSGADVEVRWILDSSAQYWKVFHSNDRYAPWPWAQIGNVTTNWFLHENAIVDMQNHFYIVRSAAPYFESPNSTMGALWHLQVAPVSGRNSGLWMSLPYRTVYKKASDVVSELGCGRINFVAKWDSSTEKLLLYHCLQNQWRGQDFVFSTGEAIMIGVKTAFDWAINGTDGDVTLEFTHVPSRYNYFWVNLPFTGDLKSVSELVMSIAGGIGPGTNTKIDAVGKWNYSIQNYDFFRYTPTGWIGTDFAIDVGVCVWIEVVSSFFWHPPLITPAVE